MESNLGSSFKMRKLKKNEKKEERSTKDDTCRTLGRCFLAAIGVCLVWGLLYTPLKTGIRHMHLPSNLAWMVTQRDLTRFVLPENNTILLTPEIPTNRSLFIVVIVCSAVPNFYSRQAIRETWAGAMPMLKNVSVFFLLGTSTNRSLNAAVVHESQKHGDVIQQDFLDTYNNLTVKSVMLLKWVNQSSVNTTYIMKTDDDMFVNLPNLIKLLRKKKPKKVLIGCLIKGATPIKDWRSKWFVPDLIFSDHFYPPYLSGTGYVMSKDLVLPLYKTALHTPFFYLEDVFITGVCTRRAGIKPENNNGFKFYKRKNDVCSFRSLITAHKMSVKELRMMWTKVCDPSIKCKS